MKQRSFAPINFCAWRQRALKIQSAKAVCWKRYTYLPLLDVNRGVRYVSHASSLYLTVTLNAEGLNNLALR